jgi:hypothetical protein
MTRKEDDGREMRRSMKRTTLNKSSFCFAAFFNISHAVLSRNILSKIVSFCLVRIYGPSVGPIACLSVHLSVCISVCSFVFLSAYLYVSMSACLSVYLSICIFICLSSVHLCVCVSV